MEEIFIERPEGSDLTDSKTNDKLSPSDLSDKLVQPGARPG